VDELRAAIDGWATTIKENLPYEVVPIKNLVEVQYGALLVALQAKGLQGTVRRASDGRRTRTARAAQTAGNM